MITKKPTYPDDRRIDLTAYMGPRRAGKRLFGGQYAANPRDPKKRYPSFITEEVFELYKASGLNVLMPEGDAYYGQDYVDKDMSRIRISHPVTFTNICSLRKRPDWRSTRP